MAVELTLESCIMLKMKQCVLWLFVSFTCVLLEGRDEVFMESCLRVSC